MQEPKPCTVIGQQKSFNIYLSQVSSCCRAYPDALDTGKTISDYVNHWQEQKNLLNQGIKIPQCEICWANEDQNKISVRQQYADKFVGNSFELYLSNACNQMCSYCSPKYSSTWQESISSNGIFQRVSNSTQHNQRIFANLNRNEDHWLNKLTSYISTCDDNSTIIRLLGGEPLMQLNSLKKFLELDHKKIKILDITTNLNPPNNKFLRWILDFIGLEKLRFTISLDATPEYNYLPRGKFNPKEFNKNLQLIQHGNVVIISVISVLSIFDLKNFIQWLDKSQIENTFFRINRPDCLDPVLVPQEFRKIIWEEVKDLNPSNIICEILTREYKPSNIQLFEQYNYLNQYFQRTGIDPTSVDNQNFKNYWNWLTTNFPSKLVNSFVS